MKIIAYIITSFNRAICLFILFTYISYRGIEMNGKTQNFFMFFFWACSLVWFATVIAKADFSSVTEMVAAGLLSAKHWKPVSTA